MHYDLIIKGGTCLLPGKTTSANIAVNKGRIAEIGALENDTADHVIEAQGLHVLPGVIDSQVHFREPGLEHKEDLATGTKSAILGGVTAIFEMPNTNPSTTSKQALNDKFARAKNRAWCDVAFFVGGTADMDIDWRELEQSPGCAGIKIFMGSSTGNLLVTEEEKLNHILTHSKRRTAVHCEDESRLIERFPLAQQEKHPRAHPIWRDAESAYLATERILKIATKTNHPVHILHVTTAKEMDLLRASKPICSVEVTPQHLTFSDADYETLGTFVQMNPPIRSIDHQQALWRAIEDGTVDVIGSDHAPHTREEKKRPYPESPSGMPGVQTLLPVMLNHVNEGKLSLERLVDLVSSAPARLYKLEGKGAICVGNDADFTIIDLKAKRVIDDTQMASKCGWTPYHKKEVQGWPLYTIIHGQIVMQDDKVIGEPQGQPLSFNLK